MSLTLIVSAFCYCNTIPETRLSRRKGLFQSVVSEPLVHGHLTLLFWVCVSTVYCDWNTQKGRPLYLMGTKRQRERWEWTLQFKDYIHLTAILQARTKLLCCWPFRDTQN